MANPIKIARRTFQLAVLIGFIALFWQSRWHEGGSAPPPLFLRLDPLAGLVTWLAPTPTWLPLLYPAVMTLLVTLLLGRVFCGWFCPLGTIIDISDHLLLRRRKPRTDAVPSRFWKYMILIAVLASALFGTQLAWLLDPLPLLTRTSALVAYPALVAAYNTGVVWARPVLRGLSLHLSPAAPTPMFALNLAALVVFVGVLSLSLLGRRTWCRAFCPLGALLGLIGRWGLLKRTVTDCVRCGRCAASCKMGAVPSPSPDVTESPADYRRTVGPECILCYDCLVCPQEGITQITLQTASGDLSRGAPMTRRQFLTAMGAGLLYAATAATGAGRRATHPRLIRPPGAIIRTPQGLRNMTEKEFRDLCLRCGQCMRACVTGGLQPAVVEAGFDGIATPILVPRLGHCEQNCTACGQVCPSGALGQFLAKEKKDIHIGQATIHTDKCLSWRKGDLYRLCLVCKEHCPYQAIRVLVEGNERRPVMDPDVCVGCGLCERGCPVKPEAAIVVYRRAASV